jgi:hypothetical protein
VKLGLPVTTWQVSPPPGVLVQVPPVGVGVGVAGGVVDGVVGGVVDGVVGGVVGVLFGGFG